MHQTLHIRRLYTDEGGAPDPSHHCIMMMLLHPSDAGTRRAKLLPCIVQENLQALELSHGLHTAHNAMRLEKGVKHKGATNSTTQSTMVQFYTITEKS